MAITVPATVALTGDKTSAASKTINGPAFGSADEIHLFCIAWQGSVASQTISLGSVPSNLEATIIHQRESTGLSGAVGIQVRMRPGLNATLQGTYTFTITVSTGTIVAWGGSYVRVAGGGRDIEITVAGTDNTNLTTTTPSAISPSAAIGDLIIAFLSLKGPTGDGFTQDADVFGGAWSTIPVAGTSGGSATTNQTLRGAYKIPNAVGTQTYNPSLGTARNYAEMIFGIKPLTAKSGTDTGSGAEGTTNIGIVATENYSTPPTDTGAVMAGAGSSVAGADLDWTSPGSITADDATTANANIPPTTNTDRLRATTFGFSLPAGAQILGIEVSGDFTVVDSTMIFSAQLRSGGADIGTTQISNVPNTGVMVIAGGATSLWGTSPTRAQINSSDFGVDIWVTNDDISATLTVAIDYITIKVFYQVVVSNAAESGSVTTGGGATQISGSDSGAGSEASVLVAVATATDSGAGSETSTLAAVASTTDANGATSEATNIKQTSADVNGATTETGAVSVTSSDTNSTTAESATANAQLSSSDANGATSEVVSIRLTVTDVNGTVTEIGVITVPVLATDTNGATTETAAIRLAASDTNGATTEATQLAATASSSDSNGVTIESASVAVPVSASDTGSGSDVATLVAKPSAADANGPTTEATMLVASLSSVDTNGTTTEASSTATFKNGSDSGSGTDAQSLVARPTDTDAGSGSDAASMTFSVSSSDTNSTTTETASKAVSIVATDNNGATTETSTLVARPIGTDIGSSAETSTLVARPIATDTSGAISEVVGISATISGTDSNGSVSESVQIAISYLVGDSGSGSETYQIRSFIFDSEGGVAVDTESVLKTGIPRSPIPSTSGIFINRGSRGEFGHLESGSFDGDRGSPGSVDQPQSGSFARGKPGRVD